MNDTITLPAAQWGSGPSGVKAPTQQAPPGSGAETGSSTDPPFSDLLEKARKGNMPQAEASVLSQMLLLALPVIAPQLPAAGAAPVPENGEAAPAQAAPVQAADLATGEPVLSLAARQGEAVPQSAQPQQPAPAGASPQGTDGSAANVQQTASSTALLEAADGSPAGGQQPDTGSQQLAAGGQMPAAEALPPENVRSGAAPGQQAPYPQAQAESGTNSPLDGARTSLQEPHALQDRASAEEPAAGAKPEAAGKTPPGAGFDLQSAQIVENHPVEPARMAEARRPQFVDQVSNNLLELDKSGGSTLRIQLHPENLGKIDLRVSSGVEGLRVLLSADLPATGSLLERHLPDLRQALSEAGVNLAGLSIDYGSSPGGSPQQERGHPAGHPVPRPSTPLQDETTGEFTPMPRGLSANGNHVDYLV